MRDREGAGLVTGTCSRTRLLADAGEDLEFLETLSAPGHASAHVYGTITHWERNLATGAPVDHGPVPDVLVTVHTGDRCRYVRDENAAFPAGISRPPVTC